MRREVVVGEHDVGRLLGDVGAADAHGDADVRVLQGRRIVDAVPGHRHDVAFLLPCPHDLELVHRRDAGVDRHFLDDGGERGLVHLGELLAGQHLVAFAENPDLLRYGHRGKLVVAGDHHRPDAYLPAYLHRVDRLFARRVHHSNVAQEHQVFLDLLVGIVVLLRQLLVGDAKYAQSVLRHRFVDRQQLVALGDVERSRSAAALERCAALQHDFGSAFHEGDDPAVGHRMDRRHALALRAERELLDARSGAARLVGFQSSLGRDDDQRAFGWIALHEQARAVLADHCVAREHAGLQQQLQPGIVHRPADAAFRSVSAATHVDRAAADVKPAHRHLALGQRAGLVGADDTGAAERLDGGHLADQRVALGHFVHGDRKSAGNDRGQRLRNGGHGQRDRKRHHRQYRPHLESALHQLAPEADCQNERTDPQSDDAEPLADLLGAPL